MVSKKNASTDQTITELVWFGFYFKSQPNQIKPHIFILRFGWLLTSKLNQTAPQTPKDITRVRVQTQIPHLQRWSPSWARVGHDPPGHPERQWPARKN